HPPETEPLARIAGKLICPTMMSAPPSIWIEYSTPALRSLERKLGVALVLNEMWSGPPVEVNEPLIPGTSVREELTACNEPPMACALPGVKSIGCESLEARF